MGVPIHRYPTLNPCRERLRIPGTGLPRSVVQVVTAHDRNAIGRSAVDGGTALEVEIAVSIHVEDRDMGRRAIGVDHCGKVIAIGNICRTTIEQCDDCRVLCDRLAMNGVAKHRVTG